MMRKYVLEDFPFLIDKKVTINHIQFFIYVGEDKKGRPVVLNNASYVKIVQYDE